MERQPEPDLQLSVEQDFISLSISDQEGTKTKRLSRSEAQLFMKLLGQAIEPKLPMFAGGNQTLARTSHELTKPAKSG